MIDRRIIILGLIILILVAVAPNIGKFSTSSTGFTTLSLTGGSSFGDKVLLQWAADGSGSKATGTFSPALVETFTGFQPGDTFEMSIEVNNQQCRYQFRDTGEVIRKVNTYQTNARKPRDTGPTCYNGGVPVCGTGYDYVEKVGQCSKPNSNGQYPDCFCQCSKFEDVGVAYKVDSHPSPQFDMDVSLNVNNKDYTVNLDNDNKVGEVGGVVHKYIGSYIGDVDCGTVSSDIVAFIPKGSNQIKILDYDRYIQVIANEPPVYNAFDDGPGYNSLVDSFIATNGDIGQLCTLNSTGSLNTASISCDPKGNIVIPSGITEIPASLLEIDNPSTTWQIVDAKVKEVNAAELVTIDVTLKNTGSQTASADVSLTGPVDTSPFSTRANVPAGSTQIVQVNYAGAGLIDEFVVTAKDVNNPANSDSKIVTLKIDPFCTFSSPGPGYVKVNTNNGCAWYCGEKIHNTDVISSSCEVVTTYDRCLSKTESTIVEECTRYKVKKSCDDTGCSIRYEVDGDVQCTDEISTCSLPLPTATESELGKTIYCKEFVEKGGSCDNELDFSNEYHCTGIGSYTTANGYLDRVDRGDTPFIPAKRDHQYFLTKMDGRMICDYVWEFGWGPEGQLDSFRTDYTLPQTAQFVDEGPISIGDILSGSDSDPGPDFYWPYALYEFFAKNPLIGALVLGVIVVLMGLVFWRLKS